MGGSFREESFLGETKKLQVCRSAGFESLSEVPGSHFSDGISAGKSSPPPPFRSKFHFVASPWDDPSNRLNRLSHHILEKRRTNCWLLWQCALSSAHYNAWSVVQSNISLSNMVQVWTNRFCGWFTVRRETLSFAQNSYSWIQWSVGHYHGQRNICALRFNLWAFIFVTQFVRLRFNPIQTRLFLGSKNQGGHMCPPSKNPVTFSESIQVNFFWKLVQKWTSWYNFGFHGNHG